MVGVKGKLTYYDHALTKEEKTNLLNDIDEIKRPFDILALTRNVLHNFMPRTACSSKYRCILFDNLLHVVTGMYMLPRVGRDVIMRKMCSFKVMTRMYDRFHAGH